MIAPTPDHIMRAVIAIRRMRGVQAGRDGFPGDLGCETQLYLGCAITASYPKLGMIAVADMCSVEFGDALFFAELCDIARNGGWMVPEILNVAATTLCGQARTIARTETRKAMVR